MIGDNDHPNLVGDGGSSKAGLRKMLADAFARTPGAVPVKSELPSAYQVAVAIVAASREMNVDPKLVAMGVNNPNGSKSGEAQSRARSYAACALRVVFPEAGPTAVGRWCGSRTPQVFISVLEGRRRKGQCRWWDEGTFRRVVAKVRAA